MEFAGLIFDCDGTLADTMPLHYEAWVATLDDYGLTFDEDRFYSLGGWPTKSVAKLLADEANLTVDLDRFYHEKENRFLALLDRVTPIAPILSEAERHRGRLPMAVATGATRDVCERILRTIGVHDWFDTIVGADDVAHHKPAPDVFLEAARRLKVEPGRCLVYEDADPGIEAARRAGMKFVDVRTVYQPRRVTARRSA
jgi:beta-phosphoglucomutase family hydrolase